MSRFPRLVALRAAQSKQREGISRSRVQEKRRSDPRVLLQRALGHAESGAFGDALVCFDELLATAPHNVRARCAHARLLQQLGDHAGAQAALLACLVVQPEHGETEHLLGRSLVELGFPKRAKACFERALRLVPHEAEVHFDLGVALLAEGDLANALTRLERATQLEPGFARAWAALGTCLIRSRHATEAFSCLERARQLAPFDAQVLRAWGEHLLTEAPSSEVLQRLRELCSDPRTCLLGLELERSWLAERGTDTELYDLFGFETLMQTYEIEKVTGHHALDPFNAALSAQLRTQTTRRGALVAKSGNLVPRSHGATRDLTEVVRAAVSDYIAKLPKSRHAFVEHRPALGPLAAHAVVVPAGARERSDHPACWLAGVYYAAAPSQPSATELGVLQVHGRVVSHPQLVCPPRAGRLVLYPGFWQRSSVVAAGPDDLVMFEVSIRPETDVTVGRYSAR